jgi:hypothetical protein
MLIAVFVSVSVDQWLVLGRLLQPIRMRGEKSSRVL